VRPHAEGNGPTVESNRNIVADVIRSWMNGTGYITSMFAPEMTWEITGRSVASRLYTSAQDFIDGVLHPFGQRFSPDDPFRPTDIRALYTDEDKNTVIIVFDGKGTTTAGTTYQNTYAWFLTFADGKVIRGTAFFDSIAYDELWRIPVT
jgi:ketosteroid isomerase-like protein